MTGGATASSRVALLGFRGHRVLASRARQLRGGRRSVSNAVVWDALAPSSPRPTAAVAQGLERTRYSPSHECARHFPRRGSGRPRLTSKPETIHRTRGPAAGEAANRVHSPAGCLLLNLQVGLHSRLTRSERSSLIRLMVAPSSSPPLDSPGIAWPVGRSRCLRADSHLVEGSRNFGRDGATLRSSSASPMATLGLAIVFFGRESSCSRRP